MLSLEFIFKLRVVIVIAVSVFKGDKEIKFFEDFWLVSLVCIVVNNKGIVFRGGRRELII